MAFAIAIFLRLGAGLAAFSFLVCIWITVLLFHIVEELRYIEQLLRPNSGGTHG